MAPLGSWRGLHGRAGTRPRCRHPCSVTPYAAARAPAILLSDAWRSRRRVATAALLTSEWLWRATLQSLRALRTHG
eukprot:6353520-Alexandrium_andersonii.AAC.1